MCISWRNRRRCVCCICGNSQRVANLNHSCGPVFFYFQAPVPGRYDQQAVRQGEFPQRPRPSSVAFRLPTSEPTAAGPPPAAAVASAISHTIAQAQPGVIFPAIPHLCFGDMLTDRIPGGGAGASPRPCCQTPLDSAGGPAQAPLCNSRIFSRTIGSRLP